MRSGRFLVCAGLLALDTASWSQSPATGDAAANDVAPGEIVVTANKREQSLSDVGLSISALSSDALAQQRVSSLNDLAAAVPSLTFQTTAFATPVLTLRGVGFYDSSLASYPAVSTYLDEAPLPFPILTRHTVFDLERVEVLKGPQGTLFGNNSTGGAINFIAAKPTRSFHAGADLTYGRFDRVEGNAFVSGPLSDTLLGRVAVTAVRADDWQRSYTRDDTLGRTRYVAGRLSLDWEPTDTLRFRFGANGWIDKSDPLAPQFVALVPQFPSYDPALSTYPFPDRDARDADWNPANRPKANERMGQLSLRGDLDVTDGIVLTSMTSYSRFRKNDRTDIDGTTEFIGDYRITSGHISSLSQEVRLSNGGARRFRWTIGGNYERSRAFEFAQVDFSQISTAYVFGYTGARVDNDQRMRNYAGFANTEFDVGSAFTLKGGIRYTQADRTFRTCSRDPGDNSFAPIFQAVANGYQSGQIPVPGFTPTNVFVPPIGNGCITIDNVTFDGTPATYLPGELRANIDQNNVSWRVGLDYKPQRHVLLYLNVAKGYKAGGFPFLSGATHEQSTPVTQESLLDVEGGFKVQTLDRRLSLSGAGFYYKYEDKQLRSKIRDPIFGFLDATINVPKSNLVGGELEASYRPIDGLSLTLAASYTKSRITHFQGFSVTNNFTDFRGSELPYTPKFQLNAGGEYRWRFGDYNPFVGANLTYRSRQFTNIGGSRGLVPPAGFRSDYPISDIFKIDDYALLDLRAGVSGPGDRWSFSVFGKNVTNTFYHVNILPTYDTVARYAGMPVTWGATIGFKY